jgi:putative endonuclease
MKTGYIYILFNKRNGTLYTGVTSDLIQRISQHKEHLVESFTSKHEIDKLGYYEDCGGIEAAILREKQIKAGSRKRKIQLIESMNPEWHDLYYDLFDG